MATDKRALIFGISGQDGAYLARLLLDEGYDVWGASRDAQLNSFANLQRLGISARVHVESATPTDFRSVLEALSKVRPDEVYNLSGQSSVGLSFHQPVETLESIALGTSNILEAMRFLGANIRFYNACSGECFGETGDEPAAEETPFRPRSPYAVAKAAAYWQVANYREAYGLYCCSGILFNHESPLRPERFATRKIVAAAVRIARGSTERLSLGNVEIERDWGWAPEYVLAMWRMLQQDRPEDFVIATGESHMLSDFVQAAFAQFGMDYHEYVTIDRSLFRPTDLMRGRANPRRAMEKMGWRAEHRMARVVSLMIEGELEWNTQSAESLKR